ncbi:MAG: DivIVA domain-containing protein [Geodermatophilaceae bacterium]
MSAFLLFFVGLVIVAGVLFLAASFLFGRGEEMAPAPPDSTPVELPDERAILGIDVRGLRLSVAARGYRMGEVDWVLEQLALALEDRDRQLAEAWRTAQPSIVTLPTEGSADG